MKLLIDDLFKDYYKDVYSYMFSLCHDVSLSEDLASEVFLEAIKSIHSFKGDSSIKTWLLSIGRYRWYNYLRKHYKENSLEYLSEVYDIYFQGNDHEMLDRVKDVLSHENDLIQKVFWLRYEGYSYAEIGEACDISENSARVLFFRIKNKLRKQIGEE